MPVSLIKVSDGNPAATDSLTNELTVKCALCDQVYRLGYSENEWNKVANWLTIAECAIREDHKRKHQVASLSLEWKPVRRKR